MQNILKTRQSLYGYERLRQSLSRTFATLQPKANEGGSYKALQTIIAESLTINSGSSVEFRAPVSITLVKDFEVKPGAEFIITPESNNCPE